MYRLLVFLVIIAIADGSCGDHTGGCPWRSRHHNHGFGQRRPYPFGGYRGANPAGPPQNFPGSTFEDIGTNLILIDNALKKFCDENNINRTSVIYGQDNYIIKYLLPEFKESDFEVKIMNRLIYTAANSKDENVKAFKDIRILPGLVNTSKASWVFEHKTLKVFIPYNTNLRNEESQYCNDVKEAIKNVPKMGTEGLELRMGN